MVFNGLAWDSPCNFSVAINQINAEKALGFYLSVYYVNILLW